MSFTNMESNSVLLCGGNVVGDGIPISIAVRMMPPSSVPLYLCGDRQHVCAMSRCYVVQLHTASMSELYCTCTC